MLIQRTVHPPKKTIVGFSPLFASQDAMLTLKRAARWQAARHHDNIFARFHGAILPSPSAVIFFVFTAGYAAANARCAMFTPLFLHAGAKHTEDR